MNISNFFKINLIKTLLISLYVKSENSIFPCKLYGNIKISINKKANIIVKNGQLFYNSSFRVKEPFHGMLEMMNNSKLIVHGNFSFYSGAHVIISNNAKLTVGSGYINRHCKIRCFSEINIGYDVAISENVTIWDSDLHSIIGTEKHAAKPINIGNHVWIGTNVIILKGVNIGDNSIIAAGSLVNKDIPSNCFAAGVPAKVKTEYVNWE